MTDRDYMRERKQKARERKLKMMKQRAMGVIMLIMSVVLLIVAINGVTVVEKDATAVLFTLPVGLYLLFSKECLVV